uniref:Uncharacterized protein n=1 Tax=Anopheles albimanus TaxID=7167 RepID=A0A182FY49_ANOAL
MQRHLFHYVQSHRLIATLHQRATVRVNALHSIQHLEKLPGNRRIPLCTVQHLMFDDGKLKPGQKPVCNLLLHLQLAVFLLQRVGLLDQLFGLGFSAAQLRFHALHGLSHRVDVLTDSIQRFFHAPECIQKALIDLQRSFFYLTPQIPARLERVFFEERGQIRKCIQRFTVRFDARLQHLVQTLLDVVFLSLGSSHFTRISPQSLEI